LNIPQCLPFGDTSGDGAQRGDGQNSQRGAQSLAQRAGKQFGGLRQQP
jgi:hypothetical protein